MPGEGLLSPRESEVLELVSANLTQADIARRLGIARSTVNVYVRRIAEKLPGVEGRTPMRALVSYVMRQGSSAGH